MPRKGTHWEKSPPALVDRFGVILERFGELEQRRMFGFPAAFGASGHLVTGLNGPRWIVRLGTAELPRLRELGGRDFEPTPGRPMTGFLTLPHDIVADDESVVEWIGHAQAHVATLPPKKPRRRSARAGSTGDGGPASA